MPRELLTASDVADVLGVSRRRATTIARRADFPRPYAVTPHGIRLWRRVDVERFDATWARQVGRPAFK